MDAATHSFAIRAARSALTRAEESEQGSLDALPAVLESVWWIAAGTDHVMGGSPPNGSRLSGLYWVRSRGLHQTVALFTITNSNPGGYAEGYAGGYGWWRWAERNTMNFEPSGHDARRMPDYDRYLEGNSVLPLLREGIADLENLI